VNLDRSGGCLLSADENGLLQRQSVLRYSTASSREMLPYILLSIQYIKTVFYKPLRL
jgi:hypothetical protein